MKKLAALMVHTFLAIFGEFAGGSKAEGAG